MDAEQELRMYFILDIVKVSKSSSNCTKCYSGLWIATTGLIFTIHQAFYASQKRKWSLELNKKPGAHCYSWIFDQEASAVEVQTIVQELMATIVYAHLLSQMKDSAPGPACLCILAPCGIWPSIHN